MALRQPQNQAGNIKEVLVNRRLTTPLTENLVKKRSQKKANRKYASGDTITKAHRKDLGKATELFQSSGISRGNCSMAQLMSAEVSIGSGSRVNSLIMSLTDVLNAQIAAAQLIDASSPMRRRRCSVARTAYLWCGALVYWVLGRIVCSLALHHAE